MYRKKGHLSKLKILQMERSQNDSYIEKSQNLKTEQSLHGWEMSDSYKKVYEKDRKKNGKMILRERSQDINRILLSHKKKKTVVFV